MLVSIDDRVGSREMEPYFPAGAAELTRLTYADAAFTGRGPDDTTQLIGVERKTISDLINSMVSGRFAGHQLIGLNNSYNIVYVVVEGIWRPSPETGLVEMRKGRSWVALSHGKRTYMYREVQGFLNTLRICTGIHVVHTSTICETVKLIITLYGWWNNKEFEEHRSHLQPNQGNVVNIVRHSLVRRVVAQLSGVGWKRAKEMNRYFTTVAGLVDGKPEDFMEVEGIGKKLSRSIYHELHGGE